MSIITCQCGAYLQYVPGVGRVCQKCGTIIDRRLQFSPDAEQRDACGGYVDNGSGVCEFCNQPMEAHTAPVSPGNEDGHYSGDYQPKDWGAQYGTPVYQLAKIIKYLARHPKKGRALDLDKAVFFVQELESANHVKTHEFFNQQTNAFFMDALRAVPGPLERGALSTLFTVLRCGPGAYTEAFSGFVEGVERLKQVLYGGDE